MKSNTLNIWQKCLKDWESTSFGWILTNVHSVLDL